MGNRRWFSLDATGLLAGQVPTDVAEYPPSWFSVDRTARRLMSRAEERVSNTVPMAVALGSTPAGNYVGCYWQYGACHPIPAQQLACAVCDAMTGTAEGHGFDDVGNFTTRGMYKALRLALTKQYVPGTGNPRENRGHAVELRLIFCSNLYGALPERAADLQRFGVPPNSAAGFFGTWHVRLPRYRGDAEMCLWLPAMPVDIGYVPMGAPVVPQQTAQFVPPAQPVMAVPQAMAQPVPQAMAQAMAQAMPQVAVAQAVPQGDVSETVPMGAPVEYARKI